MQNYPEVILAPLEYYGAGNSKLKISETFRTSFLNENEKITEVITQIYSQGKGADPPAGFGLERAGRAN